MRRLARAAARVVMAAPILTHSPRQANRRRSCATGGAPRSGLAGADRLDPPGDVEKDLRVVVPRFQDPPPDRLDGIPRPHPPGRIGTPGPQGGGGPQTIEPPLD